MNSVCRLTVAALMVSALLAGAAYARRIAWEPNTRPPVSLRLALALAEAELENHETDYFCVSASLAKTFSDGDWEFHFSSEAGKTIGVSVGSDRRVRVSEHGFEH